LRQSHHHASVGAARLRNELQLTAPNTAAWNVAILLTSVPLRSASARVRSTVGYNQPAGNHEISIAGQKPIAADTKKGTVRRNMIDRLLRLASVAAGALLILTGCGGGGGGGDGPTPPSGLPLTVTVSQNPIAASVTQIDLPTSISVSASVQGTTSASTIHVIIVDAAGTFTGAPSIGRSGPTQYQAELTLADQLTIGVHSGNLQISVCSDPQCANVLGRTTAPYAITITENPVLTGTWSHASVALAAVQGDEQVFWPVVLNTPTTRYIPYARFSDPGNVIRVGDGSQTIVAGWGTKDIALTVSPDAAPGTYSGNLEMAYCRDVACNKMYRGVTRLPYTVRVHSMTDAKPLAALPGAPDWHTVQGSSGHTGYVPVTLNPANFSPRWLWRSPDRTNIPEVLEPVTSAGKVFTIAAPSATFRITPVLFALDEATGAVAWQQPIPDPNTDPTTFGLGPLIPPAVAGDNVYVVRTVSSFATQEGRFAAFRVADGTSPFSPQNFPERPAEFGDYIFDRFSAITWSRPTYMTPRGGAMLLAVDHSGGRSFVALDQVTGARTAEWESCALAPIHSQFSGSIAVGENGSSYIATDGGLLMLDTCESIASAVSVNDGMGPAVVPGTSDVIAVGRGNLTNFDTAARQVKWAAPATQADVFIGSPAIAGATVYVQNSGQVRLEARRETDGEVLWTWQAPWSDDSSFLGNVIATQNLVFVSTRKRVYAIDTTTHEAAWIYPYPGKLAISANGILYVRRGAAPAIGEALVAINLQ
jgi:outer membrane protein assembly factor BamB